jgi:hypothetical protein
MSQIIRKEASRMAPVMNMPPRSKAPRTSDDVILTVGQQRPTLHRYRLQVDRQTKESFKEQTVAIAKGKAIKKAHPVVQVTVYDGETQERTPVAPD